MSSFHLWPCWWLRTLSKAISEVTTLIVYLTLMEQLTATIERLKKKKLLLNYMHLWLCNWIFFLKLPTFVAEIVRFDRCIYIVLKIRTAGQNYSELLRPTCLLKFVDFHRALHSTSTHIILTYFAITAFERAIPQYKLLYSSPSPKGFEIDHGNGIVKQILILSNSNAVKLT